MALGFNHLGADGHFFLAAADRKNSIEIGGAPNADTHPRNSLGKARLAVP